jgi:hypothetical protein
MRTFHDPAIARLAELAKTLRAEMRTAAPSAPSPGSLFDVPGAPGGETQWTDDFEPTQGLAVTLSSTNQVQALGIQPFKQTDVVADWLMELNIAQTFTTGTGQTTTPSNYAPFNQVGPVKLQIQNQYASVDVENGIDLYIFNMIRPERMGTASFVNVGADPAGFQAGSTALGYPTAPIAQPNDEWPAQWSVSSGTPLNYNLLLRLPAGQWFDIYYDRAITGEPVSPPHAALVSPQFMAGTTRVITPSVKFNPGLGPVTDQAVAFSTALTPTSDTATTFTGTATMSFRRHAVYAGNPAILPPVYAWQYRWRTDRFTIAGQSVSSIQFPLDLGQVLCSYVRLFDPSASSGLGLPIAFTNAIISNIQLQYGSGLLRFNGTPLELQNRWLRQHGFLLPPGVFAYDFAIDERGLMSNKRVLNTLTTAGILWKITFASAVSSTAYAVLGSETLVFVT